MIDYIKGKISKKEATSVVLEVGGFGVKINVPISTCEKIGNVGEVVTLHTVISIKNEEVNLYGFATPDEKKLFIKIINVQGIGARTALGILSEINVGDFESAVVNEDMNTLTSIHGIGPKTAKRLIFELREELKETISAYMPSPLKEAAINGLVSLGFKRTKAKELINKVLKEHKIETIEQLIKEALKRV